MKTKSWTIKKLNKLDRIMGAILDEDDRCHAANLHKKDYSNMRDRMTQHKYFSKCNITSGRSF